MNYKILTPTEKRLIALAKAIWDDEEFLSGILCDAKTEEDQQTIIDGIEKGELVTSDDVILFGLELYEKRQEQRWKDYQAERKSGFTSDEEELLTLLADIWEDTDFFILVLKAVPTQEDRAKLIRYLKSDTEHIITDDVLNFLGVDF